MLMGRLIGAHMSIAGGYHKAAVAAAGLGMTTVQIFTKNNAQWKAKPISEAEAEQFHAAIEAGNLKRPCSHASYLINLGSPNPELHQKSVDALMIELERAEQLGLVGVVLHPGTATGCEEQEGIEQVVRALNTVMAQTTTRDVEIWLESTAGQGASLGHRFEHLGAILNEMKEPSRYGICLDTCHLFAAGYPMGTPESYGETLSKFDEVVGLRWLRAWHLNDSKKALGSRVDRHDHIGEGLMGIEPFRLLLNDERMLGLPMYLETPKGMRGPDNLDAINLATLRGLLSRVLD